MICTHLLHLHTYSSLYGSQMFNEEKRKRRKDKDREEKAKAKPKQEGLAPTGPSTPTPSTEGDCERRGVGAKEQIPRNAGGSKKEKSRKGKSNECVSEAKTTCEENITSDMQKSVKSDIRRERERGVMSVKCHINEVAQPKVAGNTDEMMDVGGTKNKWDVVGCSG